MPSRVSVGSAGPGADGAFSLFFPNTARGILASLPLSLTVDLPMLIPNIRQIRSMQSAVKMTRIYRLVGDAGSNNLSP
jgi:1,4-dihydroxy-2-naphthoate octaprenyltransferase